MLPTCIVASPRVVCVPSLLLPGPLEVPLSPADPAAESAEPAVTGTAVEPVPPVLVLAEASLAMCWRRRA